eukprot:TRINITY_DN70874_c0_g1_i1.p1 TRINITY_DN70874_c0_g1~~TRINITY_DN70874_c0_g1_i1.p1  ORF type:complete len:264 (+),score=23.89 TRINITY_DN70874_c0_g1_i1:89-793(+)
MAMETASIKVEKSDTHFEYVDYTYKVIVVGSSGVGKTSFIRRAVENKFEENHTVTIAADFSKLFYQAGPKRVKLQLWDTCGLEQYRSINKMYFRGADAAMILYDSTKENTFQACIEWLKDVKENCNPSTLVYLVGTKADLPEKKISSTMAEEFRARNELAEKCEISSKTGQGINLLLEYVIRKQIEREKTLSAVEQIFGEQSGRRMLHAKAKDKDGCSCQIVMCHCMIIVVQCN